MNFHTSTAELNHSIRAATDIEDYLDREKDQLLALPLHQYLSLLLKQKGLSRAKVVRDSLLDRAYLYQIFDGTRMPSRDKLLAIAFGMGLTDEETQRMLRLGGYSELYPRVERDALILFAILHNKNLAEADSLLIDHGCDTLIARE